MKLPPKFMTALIETCLETGDYLDTFFQSDDFVDEFVRSALNIGDQDAVNSAMKRRPDVLNRLSNDIIQKLAEFAVACGAGDIVGLMTQKRPELLGALHNFVEQRICELAGTADALLSFAANAYNAGVKSSSVNATRIAEYIAGLSKNAIPSINSLPQNAEISHILDPILKFSGGSLSHAGREFRPALVSAVVERCNWDDIYNMMEYDTFSKLIEAEAKERFRILDGNARAHFFPNAYSIGLDVCPVKEYYRELERALLYIQDWKHLNDILACAGQKIPVIIQQLVITSPDFSKKLASVLGEKILPSGAEGPVAEHFVSAITRAGVLQQEDYPFRSKINVKDFPAPSLQLRALCALWDRTANILKDLDTDIIWTCQELLAYICEVEARKGSLVNIIGALESRVDDIGGRPGTFELIFRGAAATGNLDTLQWLRENRYFDGDYVVAIIFEQKSELKVPSDFAYWPDVLDVGGAACFNLFSVSPYLHEQVKNRLSRYRYPACWSYCHHSVIDRYLASRSSIEDFTYINGKWEPKWRKCDGPVDLSGMSFKWIFELSEDALMYELIERKAPTLGQEQHHSMIFASLNAFKMHCVRCRSSCKCALCLHEDSTVIKGEKHVDKSEASRDEETKDPEIGISLQPEDGRPITVEHRVVQQSKILMNMIEDFGEKAAQTVAPVQVTETVLKKVIECCRKYVDEKSKFNYHTFAEDDLGILVATIKAIAYLDFTSVFKVACKALAERVKGLSPAKLREMIDVHNGWTDQEKQSIDSDWRAAWREMYRDDTPKILGWWQREIADPPDFHEILNGLSR
ncbi:hypothetical protein NKR23_g2140 [Pleurostoma richardsiae]|uniref:SKP1 component POZ domain-containing protein n=1 Tax=Pleurostoma richardsiae TaxID=41990 RepID=A0AA38RR90_9PEZI|nr:hypothetical protein NKR23_g2140 [Pleurostoma richardsiae]